MDTLTAAGLALKLVRPGVPKQQPLRAWDAADEYLIEELQTAPSHSLDVMCDHFGALACALNTRISNWFNDSACAHDALSRNLELNDIEPSFQRSNTLFKNPPQRGYGQKAIIQLPRNGSYTHYLIEKSIEHGSQEIWLAGMMKHLPKTLLSFLQKFGEVERLPFKKKATIFKLYPKQNQACGYPKTHVLHGLTVETHANVFGRDKLDPGAAFLLKHYNKLPQREAVADLCAGSGILGLVYKKQYPQSHIHFYDESAMAINSCKHAWQTNFPADHTAEQSNAFWVDGIPHTIEHQYELIICNPPFHEHNAVSDHIAKRLFKQAKQHLTSNGQLFIVANRHLAYHIPLKRLFKQVTQVASNNKFVILCAHD